MSGDSLLIWAGVPVGLLVLVTATVLIQRYRKLVRSLVASNERLSRAQRIGRIGDWEYCAIDRTLTWSEYLCELYGRPAAARVSTLDAVTRYVDSDDMTQILSEIAQVMGTGEERRYEICAQLASGEPCFRRIVAVPKLATDGSIIGVLGTDQDITLEKEHERFQSRLHDLARIGTVNALAATLAHEIGQPLTAARNYLSALRRAGADCNDEAQAYVADIDRQLMSMSELVSGARDLVTNGRADLSETDFEKIIANTIPLLHGVERWSEVMLTMDLESPVPLLRANQAQTRHLLFNLLRNSLEAIPQDRKPAILIRTTNLSEWLEVAIVDNGGGFDGEIDPFQSLATNKSDGLGLGLSLSRTIAEAHGGRIWIQVSGTTGSEIRFTLPLVAHFEETTANYRPQDFNNIEPSK